MIEVFQYYKIDKFLMQKLQEFKSGYKINIGYYIILYNMKTKNLQIIKIY